MQDLLDIEQLHEQTFHDADIRHDVLGMFQQQVPLLLAAMQAGTDQQRADLAHRLTGSCLAIGARPLAAAAAVVEQEPANMAALGDVERLLDATLRTIAEFLAA
ncbi:MAG: Hpt domain-containing protein [Beijerinckiaceae bacterium]